MRLFKLLAVILGSLVITTSCLRDRDKEEEDQDPISALNENLQLPAGSYTISSNTEVDNSITITSNGSGTMPINTGTQMNGSISFSAPGANIIGAGMRFGSSGTINVVPISGANGNTSGTLNTPFSVSASTCDNLSKVCHDIKCYEFAVTADGKISKANIRDVALMCGGCNEPSCAPLIDPPCAPASCSGNFNSSLSGAQTGTCNCSSSGVANVGIVNSNWVVVGSNWTGSHSLSPDYYTQGCSSCPALQISSANTGDAYIAVSGSVSKSGNVYTFNATVKSIPDVVSGGGQSYSLTGAVNCQ